MMPARGWGLPQILDTCDEQKPADQRRERVRSACTAGQLRAFPARGRPSSDQTPLHSNLSGLEFPELQVGNPVHPSRFD